MKKITTTAIFLIFAHFMFFSIVSAETLVGTYEGTGEWTARDTATGATATYNGFITIHIYTDDGQKVAGRMIQSFGAERILYLKGLRDEESIKFLYKGEVWMTLRQKNESLSGSYSENGTINVTKKSSIPNKPEIIFPASSSSADHNVLEGELFWDSGIYARVKVAKKALNDSNVEVLYGADSLVEPYYKVRSTSGVIRGDTLEIKGKNTIIINLQTNTADYINNKGQTVARAVFRKSSPGK